MISGLVTTLASMPVDIAKTRYMYIHVHVYVQCAIIMYTCKQCLCVIHVNLMYIHDEGAHTHVCV